MTITAFDKTSARRVVAVAFALALAPALLASPASAEQKTHHAVVKRDSHANIRKSYATMPAAEIETGSSGGFCDYNVCRR